VIYCRVLRCDTSSGVVLLLCCVTIVSVLVDAILKALPIRLSFQLLLNKIWILLKLSKVRKLSFRYSWREFLYSFSDFKIFESINSLKDISLRDIFCSTMSSDNDDIDVDPQQTVDVVAQPVYIQVVEEEEENDNADNDDDDDQPFVPRPWSIGPRRHTRHACQRS